MGAEGRKEGSLEERVGRGLPVPLPLCVLWKAPGTGGHTSVPGYDQGHPLPALLAWLRS